MTPAPLRILITGGTFDKRYDPLNGSLNFSESHMPAILERIRCTDPIELEIPYLMDSLDMMAQHRQAILEACMRAPEDRIIVIHGTDTMRESASVLGKAHGQMSRKSIVLTGAMIPYSVSDSDALFNLGAAVTASALAGPGVWIAMNGRVFSWENVKKNRSAGIFETEREH